MKKKQLIEENKKLRLAYNLISAELRVEKINSQALISCEKANDLMHDKLECYRVVLRDLN